MATETSEQLLALHCTDTQRSSSERERASERDRERGEEGRKENGGGGERGEIEGRGREWNGTE